MACIINNINNIDYINSCNYSLGGISELYVAAYNKDFNSNIEVFNNAIQDINMYLKFNELKFSKANTKYSETYNYTDKKYDQVLDLELQGFDFTKREYIDALIKAKIIFIYKDYNGQYFIFGELSGAYSNNYAAQTDIYLGKSSYIFKFVSRSDYGLLGVNSDVVASLISGVDCSQLIGELALSSNLSIQEYYNCEVILA